MAADVVLSHSDLACGPVDVTPAQGEELALAQPSHRGDEEERSIGGSERGLVGVDGPQERLEFLVVEEVNVDILVEAR